MSSSCSPVEAVTDCTSNTECETENPCLTGLCVAGVCTFQTNSGATCDDGNSCTENEICDDQGQCFGTPIQCDDGNTCNGSEVCAEGTCQPANSDVSQDGSECGPNGFCFAQSCLVFGHSQLSPECLLEDNAVYQDVSIGGTSWAEGQLLMGVNYCKVDDISECPPRKNVCRYSPGGVLEQTGGPWTALELNSIQAMHKNLAVGVGGEIGFFDDGVVDWAHPLKTFAQEGLDLEIGAPIYRTVARAPFFVDSNNNGILDQKNGGWAWFGGTHETQNGVSSHSRSCNPDPVSGHWQCSAPNTFLPQWGPYEFTDILLVECKDLPLSNCSYGLSGIWSLKKNEEESSYRIEYLNLVSSGASMFNVGFTKPNASVSAMVLGPESSVFIAGTKPDQSLDPFLYHCQPLDGSNGESTCYDLGSYLEELGQSPDFIDAWSYDAGVLFLALNNDKAELWFLPNDYNLDAPHESFKHIQLPLHDTIDFLPEGLQADPTSPSILVVGHSKPDVVGGNETIVLWSTSPAE